jgi:hypothetical protein
MIEVDGFMLGLRGLRKQGICLRFIEIEVALYDLMQGCALDIGDVAVDLRSMHQQRSGRQSVIVRLELRRMLAALRDVGEEFAKTFKHEPILVICEWDPIRETDQISTEFESEKAAADSPMRSCASTLFPY